MNQLPEEIINTILSFSKTRVSLACGRFADARKMFLEGGPCIVLESILKHGADLKSLYKIKHHVPSTVALCKAVLTENIDYIKRVCLVWDTRESNDAYAIACRNQFVWGIQHLRPVNELTVRQYNRIYFEVGQLDKIDLTEDRPFYDLMNTTNLIKAERLDYQPFKMTLSTFELLYLYVLKGMEQQVYSIIDDDKERTINFHTLLFHAMDEGVYKLPLDLFVRYGSVYCVFMDEIVSKLVRARNMDALEYIHVPNIDIHRAIIYKDVDRLNEFLAADKESTLKVMCRYDPRASNYFDEILGNPETILDRQGNWQGLSPETRQVYSQFTFGFYDTSDDGSINMTIDKIRNNEISDIKYFSDAYGRYAPPSRILLTFIEMHGRGVLDNVQNMLYIVPYLTYIDLESTCQLLEILLECNYPIKEIPFRPRPYIYPRPAVYLSGKTIYHTAYPIDSHKCHLEDDLYTKSEFLDILFAKDIVIAFKTFAEMNC